ncbi:Uncharacterised protein [Vibrio cholerae]|nr:Uncharacterised protein [Vibrio cholerae]CSI66840.1 Uncharacterised protein [Vibrio cholerae]
MRWISCWKGHSAARRSTTNLVARTYLGISALMKKK